MSAHANPIPNRIPDQEELWQIVTTSHDEAWYATEPGVDIVGKGTCELAALIDYLEQLRDSR